MGRFVLIVLDSFGVGAMNDCAEVRPRDVGSNTAKHIIQSKPDIKIPTLEKLGLMNAIGEEVGEHKFNSLWSRFFFRASRNNGYYSESSFNSAI